MTVRLGSVSRGLRTARSQRAERRLRLPGTGRSSLTVSHTPDATTIARWDDLVRAHPAGDVAQLSAWTRIRGLAGYTGMHVLAFDNGHLVGGAQILLRRVHGLGALGYVPYGPLVSPAAADPDGIHDLLSDALAHLGRRRFRALFVQPPESAERASQALLQRGFRNSDAEVAPAATLRIDLHLSEAELRRNLSKRLRTWTNSWEERGVTVRLGGEGDLRLLAELLADTAEHQGFTPFGLDYLSAMHRELASAGHLRFFVGEVDGHPLAMTVFTACGSAVRVRLLGLDRSDEGRRLNVPGAVYWTAMRWAKDAGYRWFDFGGVYPSSLPALRSGRRSDLDALSGPDRFKARFGGQPFEYPPPVELISSPVLRAGYDLARRSAAGRHVVLWAQQRSRSGYSVTGSHRRPGADPRREP